MLSLNWFKEEDEDEDDFADDEDEDDDDTSIELECVSGQAPTLHSVLMHSSLLFYSLHRYDTLSQQVYNLEI